MSLRGLLAYLLPHRRTSEEEVRAAMIERGIDPGEVGWSVGADGSFAFGRKGADGPDLTYENVSHLLSWARQRRIKVRLIGWEQQADA